MPPGRIYILMNPAFKGLLKIGKTTLSAEERAAQLSKSTGVPKPFFVAYDEPTAECDLAEKLIHKRLAEYRCESRREFFELPFKKALAVVLEVVNEVDAQTKIELREHQRNLAQPDRHKWTYSPSGPATYKQSLGRVLTRSINWVALNR